MVGLSSYRMMTEILLVIEDNRCPQCAADSEEQ
jgi:hypothetical protein